MPIVADQYSVNAPQADPSGGAASAAYTARPKSFFLAGMLRTLRAAGGRLYPAAKGSVVHRFLDAVAVEQARQDLSFHDAVERAIRNAVYEAFSYDFTTRLPATYAAGYGRWTRAVPAPVDETLPAGSILGTLDGRTAVTTAAVTVLAGQTQAAVVVRAEVAGVAGNTEPGALVRVLSPVPGPYAFVNTTALDGGREEESDDAVAARWATYITSGRSADRDAILARVLGISVVVGTTTYAPRDVALVHPWLVPELNLPPGAYWAVIDAGGGTAPTELVAAVQAALDPDGAKTASGNVGLARSCAALVIAPTITYTYRAGTDPLRVDAALTAAWADFLSDSLVEDGRGRGEVDAVPLPSALRAAHPGIVELTVGVTSIRPPLAARAVAGTPTYSRTVA